ncbi:MAG: exodeoxyribonuclease III [Thermomicrobiales bacterium]|nr:exodeoxyribonuclease III [Thermomicrobiales bacterium]
MRIYSWNVNGIRAVIKKGAWAEFIAQHQPDIVCLQETKAKEGQAKPDLPDYLEYWNSAERAGYAGTAIFSRTEPLTVLRDLPEAIESQFGLHDDSYGNPNTEGRVLALEFPQFWIATVYTPNSKRDLSRIPLRFDKWDPAFLGYMKQLEAGQFGTGTPKPVIYCGDFNVAHEEIDLARPKENVNTHGFTPQERERFGDMVKAGFVDTFRTLHPDARDVYSWWNQVSRSRDRNVGWRIDYVMVSKDLLPKVTDAEVHMDVMGSDHCPVSITLAD